jgi:hypothetical protein
VSWHFEFPNFGIMPQAILDALARGEIDDVSWGNDACPCFVRKADVPTIDSKGTASGYVPVLWVEREDPTKREMTDVKRFVVVDVSTTNQRNTDDAEEALKWLREMPAVTDKLGTTLKRAGFEVTATGGGCQAYVRNIGNGLRLFVTDGQAALPTDGDEVFFAVMCDDHGDPLAEHHYKSSDDFLNTLPKAFNPAFTAASSHGTYTASAITGELISNGSYDDNKCTILRFNVDEWRNKYPGQRLENAALDILDLGYWYRDNSTGLEEYTEPAHDWRAEMKRGGVR